jgi:plasmid stability protein
MVNSARALEKFIVRLPQGMREAIRIAAEKNRRSMNAEIVARLAQSLDMPEPIEPGGPIASETAREALRRVKAIEDALRVVCDDKCVDNLPDNVREIFVKLSDLLYAR